MKLALTNVILCAALLTSSPLAYAQTTTASSTESNGGIFESVIERVSDVAETVQEQVTPAEPEKAVLSARSQERITNLAANISNRFDAIIARLQNITSRLDTRIEKLNAAQVDTTGAKQSLNAAQTALDAARADMRGIDEKVLRVVGSTDPKSEWREVRATFVSARDNIKVAHSELRNTVTQLKALETPVTQ